MTGELGGGGVLLVLLYSARGPRGANGLDGGSPCFRAQEAANGRWMVVGAIAPQFCTASGTMPGRGCRPAPRPGGPDAGARSREHLAVTCRARTRE
jgi:hypothetical protein